MKDKLLKIINHYGLMYQLKYFQSEIFELNEAIINTDTYDELAKADMIVYENNREYFVKHIAEEIADCYVMLEQFKCYYGITNGTIDLIMEGKIDRQLEKIEREKDDEK